MRETVSGQSVALSSPTSFTPPSPPPAAPHHLTQTPQSGAFPASDTSSLAAALMPALRKACSDRLSAIQWFRAAWQAGGASTGFATFRTDDGDNVEVVVKLPVGPAEYRWTTALGGSQELGGPTPRVLAHGTEINGYDLAWLVVEKLPGSPLSAAMNKAAVEALLAAAAEWYACAERIRAVEPPEQGGDPHQDWVALLHKSREAIRGHAIEEAQRWNEAIKHTQRILRRLMDRWGARTINTWCHGDLHPGNAMWRTAGAGSDRCILLDLALVHPGHWVEDAVYLERLYWGRPELLDGVKPVSCLAKARRALGLQTDDDYGGLANIRRVLMAASAPAYIAHEGHPKYLHAAVETLERLLPQVSK